jgi:hypothetical protein
MLALHAGDTTTVAIRDVSPEQAQSELATRVEVEWLGRQSHCFQIVRSQSAISTVPEGATEVDSVVDFIAQYGVLLTESGQSISEQIELMLMREPTRYRRGKDEGVVVLFRQRVGAFDKQDTLIGARFVEKDLRLMAGCIHDPAKSPTRVGGLSLPNAEAARAAFRAQLGADSVADEARVRGLVWFESGRAEWIFGAERVDALTGAYLGEVETHPGDPADPDDVAQPGGGAP